MKARHKASGCIVALKRVWQNSNNGFGGSSRNADGTAAALPAALLREAEALRMVRHPNVVLLHRTFPLVSITLASVHFATAMPHAVHVSKGMISAASSACKQLAWIGCSRQPC